MIARLTAFGAVVVLGLSGCAYAGALQSWSPSRAESDAERDIAARNVRFAYVGGRAPHAPGLPEGASSVTQRYPRLAVGPQGCIQDHGSDVRWEYARRYNRRMWRHVSRDAT
jgi:hypothetical protein